MALSIGNKNDVIKSLLADYFKKKNKFSNLQKNMLFSISEENVNDNQCLFELYFAVYNKKDTVINQTLELKYDQESSQCYITYRENTECFEHNHLREVIANLLDLTDDVLPLGSLVELKKEYFSKIVDVSKIEKIWAIITYRFLDLEGKSYFTYGGVIYPVANFNNQEILRFSPALINNVIYKGYTDDQEDAYVYLMKRELILENDLKSAGYYIGGEKDE